MFEKYGVMGLFLAILIAAMGMLWSEMHSMRIDDARIEREDRKATRDLYRSEREEMIKAFALERQQADQHLASVQENLLNRFIEASQREREKAREGGRLMFSSVLKEMAANRKVLLELMESQQKEIIRNQPSRPR